MLVKVVLAFSFVTIAVCTSRRLVCVIGSPAPLPDAGVPVQTPEKGTVGRVDFSFRVRRMTRIRRWYPPCILARPDDTEWNCAAVPCRLDTLSLLPLGTRYPQPAQPH